MQYYVDLVNATGAWSLMSGLPSVVVAVVDTGVDLEHPDLRDQLWTNPGEIPGGWDKYGGNQVVPTPTRNLHFHTFFAKKRPSAG
jgi:subtilisin family serine protease